MSDDSAHDREEIDPGEPIALLAELVEPPRVGFLGRVRRKIDRRTLTGNVVTMGWELPKVFIVEFLNMIFGLFGAPDDDKGGPRD